MINFSFTKLNDYARRHEAHDVDVDVDKGNTDGNLLYNISLFDPHVSKTKRYVFPNEF